MAIKGLIFDFDGLILDTESPLYDAWCEIYSEYGCSLSLEKYSACVGATFSAFDPAEYLGELTGLNFNQQELHKRAYARAIELQNGKPLLEGIPQLFLDAKDLGIKLAVASSSTREWVLGNLNERGLQGYFDVIRTMEDVDQAKPDPALYISALSGLGLAPSEAIAFEDSYNGVAAARAAGLKVCAVPNSLTCFMDFSSASKQLSSLAEYPLTELIKLLEEGANYTSLRGGPKVD